MNRRSFLTATACLGASTALSPAAGPSSVQPPRKRIKLGIASYSYWHFRDPRISIEAVIDKAADLGVDGVDILHRQMDVPEKEPLNASQRSYLHKLKRQAFRNGVSLCCFSTHQSFLSPDKEKVTANVEHTKKCIQMCHEMGIPSIRINTGRWGTIDDFDELMRKRGVEPILPGCTEEEGYKWVIDGIERCLPKAEECGVMLLLENHWGLARLPEGQLRILNSITSPWFAALMDTGNFLEDPYDKLKMIASQTAYVQAKAYDGGGEWYTLDLDYKRIAKILQNAGYAGFVSLEFEGKQDPDIAVPNNIRMLREAFDL